MLQLCKGSGNIGRLPILISSMAIINGVSSIFRTWALFPVFGFEQNYDLFFASYFIEDVSFYLAIFLFGAMYYEVSMDIERAINPFLQQEKGD